MNNNNLDENEENRIKISPFYQLDFVLILIWLAAMIFFNFMLFTGYRIAGYSILAGIIAVLFLYIFRKKLYIDTALRSKKFKVITAIMRIFGYLLMIFLFFFNWYLESESPSKQLYKLQKWNYDCYEELDKFFPDEIPDSAYDYESRFMRCCFGQHTERVSFRCGKEDIDKLRERAIENNAEKIEDKSMYITLFRSYFDYDMDNDTDISEEFEVYHFSTDYDTSEYYNAGNPRAYIFNAEKGEVLMIWHQ